MRNKYISEKVRKGLKADAVSLALKGFGLMEIAETIGVTYATFYRWRLKDTLFERALEEAKAKFAKGKIESLLWKVAEGGTEEEESVTYRMTKVINDEEVNCLVTNKKKVKAPSEKAILMLANKYTDGDYSGLVEKAVHHKITQRDRALTLDERLNLLKSEGTDPIPTDFRELTKLGEDDTEQ